MSSSRSAVHSDRHSIHNSATNIRSPATESSLSDWNKFKADAGLDLARKHLRSLRGADIETFAKAYSDISSDLPSENINALLNKEDRNRLDRHKSLEKYKDLDTHAEHAQAILQTHRESAEKYRNQSGIKGTFYKIRKQFHGCGKDGVSYAETLATRDAIKQLTHKSPMEKSHVLNLLNKTQPNAVRALIPNTGSNWALPTKKIDAWYFDAPVDLRPATKDLSRKSSDAMTALKKLDYQITQADRRLERVRNQRAEHAEKFETARERRKTSSGFKPFVTANWIRLALNDKLVGHSAQNKENRLNKIDTKLAHRRNATVIKLDVITHLHTQILSAQDNANHARAHDQGFDLSYGRVKSSLSGLRDGFAKTLLADKHPELVDDNALQSHVDQLQRNADRELKTQMRKLAPLLSPFKRKAADSWLNDAQAMPLPKLAEGYDFTLRPRIGVAQAGSIHWSQAASRGESPAGSRAETPIDPLLQQNRPMQGQASRFIETFDHSWPASSVRQDHLSPLTQEEEHEDEHCVMAL